MADNRGIFIDEVFARKLRERTATDMDFAREANRIRWERLRIAIERLENN